MLQRLYTVLILQDPVSRPLRNTRNVNWSERQREAKIGEDDTWRENQALVLTV
jgi:hypothetical protein